MRSISPLLVTILLAASIRPALAQTPGELGDVEMAHVAVTASDIDIAYAHLALALSDDVEVRRFADTMIRHHTAVNEQIAALAERLGVRAKDNPLSRQLSADAVRIKDELSQLRGAAFDRAYAANELEYHRTVNGVVEASFIPNIDNAEVRDAFRAALTTFRRHEERAAMLVDRTTDRR